MWGDCVFKKIDFNSKEFFKWEICEMLCFLLDYLMIDLMKKFGIMMIIDNKVCNVEVRSIDLY